MTCATEKCTRKVSIERALEREGKPGENSAVFPLSGNSEFAHKDYSLALILDC